MFKRYWWMLLVMAPVGMMAGFMVAAVVTYVMPKKYESYATIEIKNRAMVRNESGEAMYLQIQTTDYEKIKSLNSLSKVIDALDLTNRWGTDRETALQILKGSVRTENIRGTDLIQVRVRHTNKVDARDIAAGVAREYKEYRRELESVVPEQGINAIRKAVREQEDKVGERRKILQMDPRNNPSFDGTDPVDLQAWVDAKRDFETELALLEQMKIKLITDGMGNGGIPAESVVVHDDPVIADAPITPNVTLNLVAGAASGLLISPFLALPLMWWMNRRKR